MGSLTKSGTSKRIDRELKCGVFLGGSERDKARALLSDRPEEDAPAFCIYLFCAAPPGRGAFFGGGTRGLTGPS